MNRKYFFKIATMFLLALFVLKFKNGNCQQQPTWFEPGSSWVYNYQNYAGPDHFQANFIISEFVFENQDCVKMETIEEYPFVCSPFDTPFYFYESNDSIFYATEIDSTFRLAYNFNAEIGESWEYIVPSSFVNIIDTFNVEVISVNTVNIDGSDVKEMLLSYQNVSLNQSIEIFPEEISVLEFIGSTNGLFIPFGNLFFCDGETAISVQCFTSENMNYTNPNFNDCSLGIMDYHNSLSLKIFPNPTRGMVYFSEKIDFRLVDLSGREIARGKADFVDLSAYAPGVYLIEIGAATFRIFRI